MVAKDVSRETSNVVLPAEVSNEIWAEVQDASVVMNLARKVTLPGAGVTYQQILTDSVPQFVGETERKPVSNPTFDKKTMQPHKLAVVQTYSDEFRRDLPGLFAELLARLPGTLATAFDRAVLFGEGAPQSNFDTFSGISSASILNATQGSVDAYQGFLTALGAVPKLDRWALSAQGEIVALGNRDTAGMPILVNSPTDDGSIGRMLGRPVFRSENAYDVGAAAVKADEGPPAVEAKAAVPATLGFGGDWRKAYWGQVEAVSIDISDNPVFANNGTLITAGWQDNMIAVRAEIHVGFIADTDAFVRLTGATPSA